MFRHTRKLVTDFDNYMGDLFITWKTRKQDIVSRSSSEVDMELLSWCRVRSYSCIDLCMIYKSNLMHARAVVLTTQATITIASNPTDHERTKHTTID